MAGTFSSAQFTARALPLSRTSTTGLPVAVTALSNSSFAFDRRRDAEHHDDRVRLARGAHGLLYVPLGEAREGPDELRDGAADVVVVLDPHVIRAARLQAHVLHERLDRSAVRPRVHQEL